MGLKSTLIIHIISGKLMCDKEGCMTLANDLPGSVLVFDGDHLTGIGSEYLVSLFKDDVTYAFSKDNER